MNVSELGEFGLIDRLRKTIGEPAEGEVWVGDDTAVLRAPAGTIFFTTDLMVEGVHFDLELTGPEDLGYKSIAVNMSDIASMGGTPRRALVGLGLRAGIDVEWVEALYGGMNECAEAFDSAVVGGDVSRSDCLLLSVAMIGNPAGRRVVTRAGARQGDVICVTGVLGASAAGYRLLRAGRREGDLVRRHRRPIPRVREAEVLRRHLPTAMIDVSDGFAADLGHLCGASNVGAVVEAAKLPVVDLAGEQIDREALELALGGGEDYELCFTIPPDRAEKAASAISDATGTRISFVGEVVSPDRGRILKLKDGSEEKLEAKGWDHLSS